MPKFEIGKKYYCIHQNHKTIKIDCPICKGTGLITLEIDGTNQNFSYKCSECHGSGGRLKDSLSPWEFSYEKRVKLTSISIEEGVPIYYFSSNKFKEENIFALKREAQKEIDKRNAELELKESK